jgi:dephospho-CoA kinase
MFVLGLTGSLGMGKSTTAGFFAELGVPVHDADATVHRLYKAEAVSPIEAAFPGTAVNGEVDREKLAKRVLDDPAAIKKLEGIVHPLVRAAEERFLTEVERKNARVAVLDIPLLFETGSDRRCDAVVVVSAPKDVQRARIFERPGMTAQKFATIAANQMPDAEKRKRADFVVDTSKGFDAARVQVREILARIATMPKRRY